jgi:hypothetical protein
METMLEEEPPRSPPGSCFSGGGLAPTPTCLKRIRSANLALRVVCAIRKCFRPDLIRRPGVGTSLREGIVS